MDLPIIVIISLFIPFFIVVMFFYNKGNSPKVLYPIKFEDDSNNSSIPKDKTSDMLIYISFTLIVITLLTYISYSSNLYLNIILTIILIACSIYMLYFIQIKTNKKQLQDAKVTCPNCGYKNPQSRIPKTMNQFLYGGWICKNCNCKFIFNFKDEKLEVVDEFTKQDNLIKDFNKYYHKKFNETYQDTYSFKRLLKYMIILTFMAFIIALILAWLNNPQDVIDKFDIFLK